MNNSCSNFKTRTKNYKRYFYCSKLKKEITYENCRNCKNKEHKEYTKLKSNSELKKRTYKQAKAEKNRYSLFTNDLDHCIEENCKNTEINLHEIFFGRNRQNSIKFGLVIPLCVAEHHNQVNCRGIHFDAAMCLKWHKLGQLKFEENHTRKEFIDIFGKNYL